MILVYSGLLFGVHALHLYAIEVTATLTSSTYVAPKAYIIITTVTPTRCNSQKLLFAVTHNKQVTLLLL